MKRVVCLYRVSTLGQVDHDDSPMQRKACREYIPTHPDWEIVKEVVEKGVSGYKVSTNARDAIVEIKAMAMAKQFDVLLVFMFDRLGRREDETPFVVQWFVTQGVEVWSTREGEQRFDTHVDKLLNYIRFWQASGESEKTAIRVRTKHSQMVQDEQYRGGLVPYGYHPEFMGRTNKKNQQVRDLVIDENEANTVRQIFHLITDEGYGTNRVANWLNERGITTKRNTTLWRGTSVRALIDNPVYIGILRFGDERSEIFEALRIVDDATFQRCGVLVRSRAPKQAEERTIPIRTDNRGLLTGLLFCAECGSRLTFSHNVTTRCTSTGYHQYERDMYRCYRKINSRKSCDGQSTYCADQVEKPILEAVYTFFANIRSQPRSDLLKSACKSRCAVYRQAYKQAEADFKKAHTEMAALEEEAIKALTGEARLDVSLINSMLPKYKAKLDAAQAQMEEAQQKLAEEEASTLSAAHQYDQMLSWADTFEDASIETKHMILASLIERIEVGRGYAINVKFRLSATQYLGMAS